MWQRSTRRKLAGKMAPLKSELLKFLAEHTDCEVYTGQDLQKSDTSRPHLPTQAPPRRPSPWHWHAGPTWRKLTWQNLQSPPL